MEKDLEQNAMDCPTLLLIHQLINYQISIHKGKKSRVEANLKRIGSDLGTRIMMKVSNGHSSRTRDAPQILRLFSSEFWPFVFGKKPSDIVIPNANSITFKDVDFELMTRVSSVETEQNNVYLNYIQVFCVSMFESALGFLDLNADVIMKKMERFTLLEISCN